MKYAMTLAVLLMVVSAVSAAVTPSLYYVRTDLGGGLFAYDFKIDCDDGLMASYAATLAFEAGYGTPPSTINQILAFGAVSVDTQSAGDNNPLYTSAGGYIQAKDTWVATPFGDNPIPGTSPRDGSTITGVRQGTGWFEFATATGASSAYGDNTLVAHVVFGGSGVFSHVWGTIARNSVLYTADIRPPEPGTIFLLSAGTAWLLKRRR